MITNILTENRDIHQSIPDHRVKLTPDGWTQAHEAGRRLRALLKPTDTLHFFTSPYRRTRETTDGILSTLTSDDPSPSPFARSAIKVYEEPRLREQDFGNFQPCSAEMERMWQERADYGHFFYRIPNGESAADAYDRVSGFNESLWRQFGEDDFASVCVLVTHGLMSRVFLMKWYHFSVEYFEDLRNVNHCEFLIMRKQETGKYLLENHLRTWSQLKRERAAALKNKTEEEIEKANEDGEKAPVPMPKNILGAKPGDLRASTVLSPVAIRSKWGGCPNGCNHGKQYRRINTGPPPGTNGSPIETPPIRRRFPGCRHSSDDDDWAEHNEATSFDQLRISIGQDAPLLQPHTERAQTPSTHRLGPAPKPKPPRLLSEPSQSHSNSHTHTPSPFHPHLHLHPGRDFGGSASGHNSRANTDVEDLDATDAEESRRHDEEKAAFKLRMREKREREFGERSGMNRGARADALGDQSDEGGDKRGSGGRENGGGHGEVHGPGHGMERHKRHDVQEESEEENAAKNHELDTEADRQEKSVEGCVR
jgi:broad specificity phosphatase PhoE